MKFFLLLLLVLPLRVMPQRHNKQCKKCKDPCSNCMAPITPPTPNLVTVNLVDTTCCDLSNVANTLVKGLKKDDPGFLEKYGGLIGTLIIAGVTLWGFSKALRQMYADNISKARLEFIKEIRPLGTEFINKTTETDWNIEDVNEAYTKMSIDDTLLKEANNKKARVTDEINRLNEKSQRMRNYFTSKKSKVSPSAANNHLAYLENKIKLTYDELDKVKNEASKITTKGKNEEIINSKKDTLKNSLLGLDKSWNALLLVLNAQSFGKTHEELSKLITDYIEAGNSNKRGEVSGTIKDIRNRIQKVISEQWDEAGGKLLKNKSIWNRLFKKEVIN